MKLHKIDESFRLADHTPFSMDNYNTEMYSDLVKVIHDLGADGIIGDVKKIEMSLNGSNTKTQLSIPRRDRLGYSTNNGYIEFSVGRDSLMIIDCKNTLSKWGYIPKDKLYIYTKSYTLVLYIK